MSVFGKYLIIPILVSSFSQDVPPPNPAAARAFGLSKVPSLLEVQALSRLGKGGPPPPVMAISPVYVDSSYLSNMISKYPGVQPWRGNGNPPDDQVPEGACVAPVWPSVKVPNRNRNPCFNQGVREWYVLSTIQSPTTWTLLHNWWGKAFILQNTIVEYEDAASGLSETVFGLDGNTSYPTGEDGLFLYAQSINNAANQLKEVGGDFNDNVVELSNNLAQQTSSESANAASIQLSNFGQLASAVQNISDAEYGLQHRFNQDLFVARSNRRLATEYWGLNFGYGKLPFPEMDSLASDISAGAEGLSDGAVAQSSAMNSFQEVAKSTISNGLDQPVSLYLSSKAAPVLDTATARIKSGLDASAASSTNLAKMRINTVLTGDATNSTDYLASRNSSSNSSLVDAAGRLLAVNAVAAARLSDLQDYIRLKTKEVNMSNAFSIADDYNRSKELVSVVASASSNASAWGSKTLTTTGELRNDLVSRQAYLMSMIAREGADTNSSLLKPLLKLLSDIEAARKSMLLSAAESSEKMRGLLAQLAASLGLSFDDTVRLVASLSASMSKLKDTLDGTVSEDSNGRLSLTAKVSAELQSSLTDAAYAVASSALAAVNSSSRLMATGKGLTSGLLTTTTNSLSDSFSKTAGSAQQLASLANRVGQSLGQNASEVAKAQYRQSKQVVGLLGGLSKITQDLRSQKDRSDGIVGSLSLSTSSLGTALGDSLANFSRFVTASTKSGFRQVGHYSDAQLQQVGISAQENVGSLAAIVGRSFDDYSSSVVDSNATTQISADTVSQVQGDVQKKAKQNTAWLVELIRNLKYKLTSTGSSAESSLKNAESQLVVGLASGGSSLHAKVLGFQDPLSKLAGDTISQTDNWTDSLNKQLLADKQQLASNQASLETLTNQTSKAGAATQAAMSRLSGVIDRSLNSSTLTVRNLSNAAASLNSTSSLQIQTSLSDLRSNSTRVAQNVSDAIKAVVEQYTATVGGVTAQLNSIASQSSSNHSLSVNATAAKLVLDSLSALIERQKVLEKTLGDLIQTNAKDRAKNLTIQVLDPSKLLISAVGSIFEGSDSNRTWLDSLLSDVSILSESTMRSTWHAVQQAQGLSTSKLKESQSEAQFDILAQSGANKQNSYLAKANYAFASSNIVNQNQILAGARYEAANSAQAVLTHVGVSRANLTAMLGQALGEIGQSESDTAGQLLASQTKSSTDPASVRQTVSNILSTWEAFSASALDQAD